MPISLTRWNRYERLRWMWRMRVRKSRFLSEQVFMLHGRRLRATTRYYLLADKRIVYETYAYWQTETELDVVMVEYKEIEAHQYFKPPI